MAPQKSSFDRLHEAGILEGEKFTEVDKQVIEKITPDEVDVLIRLRQKMGSVPPGKEHMRPNFGV